MAHVPLEIDVQQERPAPRIMIVSVPRSSDFRKPGGGIVPRFERPVAETALALRSGSWSAGEQEAVSIGLLSLARAPATTARAMASMRALLRSLSLLPPSFRSPEVRRFSTNRAFLTSPHQCNAFVRMSNAVRTAHCNVIRLIERVYATVQYSGK
jgi:hypothetical protein